MDFDSLPDDAAPAAPVVADAPAGPQPASVQAEALPSFDSLVDDTEKYSTPIEKAKTFGEGVGQGLAGPLYTGFMKVSGATSPEDYLAREQANPYTKMAGEVAGLVGSEVAGVGMGAAMGKAGKAAQTATGLNKVADYELAVKLADQARKAGSIAEAQGIDAVASLIKPTYAEKVGSAAVREAAQMAVYQSGNEISKMIMNDPDTSAESALAHVGLASVLGGVGGAAVSGVISPLWDVTAKQPTQKLLGWLRGHLDGTEAQAVKNYGGVKLAEDVAPKNTMELVHYSPKELDVIDPAFSGTGVDARTQGRAVEEKFSHYYREGAPMEDVVTQGSKRHTVTLDLDKEKLYDLNKDADGVIEALRTVPKQVNPGVVTMDDISRELKKRGYTGFIRGEHENVHMFTSQKVNKPLGNAAVRQVADDYAAAKGITLDHNVKLGIDPERSTAIAQAYDQMKHDPENPAVQRAYKALIKETLDQWQAIKKTGLKVSMIPEGAPNPYKNSKEMADDIAKNNHLWFFPTSQGFGSEAGAVVDHPLQQYTGEVLEGKALQANDIFRIVHDYFGHAKEGTKFGPIGEENAWRHHMQMYSPEAQKALTTETRGQNSWVNFGPHGEANRTNPANTIYAEQKAGLLPDWVMDTTPNAGPTIDSKMVRGSLPSHIHEAAANLGIEVPDIIKGFLSDDPRIRNMAEELRVAQHPEVMEAIAQFRSNLQEAVAKRAGLPLEELASYDNHAAGRDMLDRLIKDVEVKYGDIDDTWKARNELMKTISVPDEQRLRAGDRIIEQAMKNVRTDSNAYKIYMDARERLLASETIGDIDMLRSEYGNKITRFPTDYNDQFAYKNVRNLLSDFVETEISRQARMLEREGADQATAIGRDILKMRKFTDAQYKEYATFKDQLADHLGLRSTGGHETLKARLKDLTPESLVKKLSPRENADFISFMQQNLPETIQAVKDQEMKRLIAPSVKKAEGQLYLDFNQLSRTIATNMRGGPQYVDFALPKDLVSAVDSARVISDTLAQKVKDSGTPGGIGKVFKHMTGSAISAVGLLMGHNPVSSYLVGEAAQRLGKNAPEALKLAYMKFLTSEAPVEAAGFRSAVEMIDNAIKGELAIQKAVKAVAKPGAQVITSSQIPDDRDREKLDKAVDKFQQNPQQMMPKDDDGQAVRLGHYMPEAEQSVTMAQTRALQYLATIKPQPHKFGPLDAEVPPTPAEVARYNRALDIAQTPAIVLQHIQEGTLQKSDIQDLQNMYPKLYSNMVQKLTDQIGSMKGDDEAIPYKTRVSMALFMGAPLDGTMTPQAIMAAQPKPAAAPQQAPQGKTKVGAKAASSMGKNANLYRTQSQDAEVDRGNR